MDQRKVNANKKKLYRDRKSKGLCVSCGCKEPDGLSCSNCKTAHRKASKKFRSRRLKDAKIFGWCTECFIRFAVQGRKLCGVCAESKTELRKILTDTYRNKGLCIKCGKEKACDTKTCRSCLDVLKKHRNERHSIKQICISCKTPVTSDNMRCKPCLDRFRKVNRLKRQKQLALGLCTKCGCKKTNTDFSLCLECKEHAKLLKRVKRVSEAA